MSQQSYDPFEENFSSFPPVPPHPGMMMTMISSAHAPMTTVADKVHCTTAQLALKTGDYVMPSMTEAVINHEICVARVLDPAEHAAAFPDWEDRVMNSWVLTEWVSNDDFRDGLQLGWFERARLMPITTEQSDEVQSRFEEWDKSNDVTVPDWIQELTAAHVDALAETDPELIKRRVTCGKCSSRKVEIHGVQMHEIAAPAAEMLREGKLVYVNAEDLEHEHKTRVHLHCSECGAKKMLEGEDYFLD